MNALLVLLALAISVGVAFAIPDQGPGAIVVCAGLGALAAFAISRHESHSEFLLQVFVGGLVLRVGIGALIYALRLQSFFGGDAITYDSVGIMLLQYWRGVVDYSTFEASAGIFLTRNWGMPYLVALIYGAVGQNMLAVQFFNAVVGAATAPVIFLCAHHIFQNLRVAKLTALFVAFFPSLVLWSSQGLKDGPVVFLLAVVMLSTLKLGERLCVKYFAVLVLALYGLLTLRFYIFYMTVAAICGAFSLGMRSHSARNSARQFLVIVAMGLAFTYLGVLRTASTQFEQYGDLDSVQRSRADLASSANSGFGTEVDVSTTAGALKAIPVGIAYLLFAPFPWQVANLRQSITLPEMIAWWSLFPLLVLGVWFTVKFRLKQALPILIFTSMLTLAYSIFQGNVGTAYRQRSQLLVFYFIFIAVGLVLMKERRELQRQQREMAKRAAMAALHRPPRAPAHASARLGARGRAALAAPAAAGDVLKARAAP